MLPKAVVFDVDGVLFDTEVMIRRGWEAVSTRLGRPEIGQQYLDYVGQSRKDIVDRLHSRFGADFDALAFLVEVTDFCIDRWEHGGLILKPGVTEILDYLESRNVPMALATSTRASRTARRMELTGLGHYFRAFATGDMVTHGKPDPEIYLLACEKLGVDPGQALAVEDVRNGIRSAYGAGMQVVMIPDLIPHSAALDPMLLTWQPDLLQLRNYLMANE